MKIYVMESMNNRTKISKIFSAIIQIKILILIVNFIVLILIIIIFDKLYDYKEIYILTYGMVIGQALFPIWLFKVSKKCLILPI